MVNFAKEAEKYSKKNLLAIIKPKLTIKDIKLVSNREIDKITTYLIPALYITCQNNNRENFPFLIDKIKGKIILDPDSDQKVDLSELNENKAYYKKPVFENIDFDVKLNEKIGNQELLEKIKNKFQVIDSQECFIVFNKVEYKKVQH